MPNTKKTPSLPRTGDAVTDVLRAARLAALATLKKVTQK